MNSDWQEFLATQSAQETTVAGTVRLIPLNDRASIRVAGEDAGTFLQALLTQEVLLLDGSTAARSAFCNAKGRTYSTLTVHPLMDASEQGYRLTLPTSLVDDSLKLLRMYVLRRKVELDAQDDWVQVGLIGQATDIPLPDLPQAPLEQNWIPAPGSDANLMVTREDTGSSTSRFTIQGPVSSIKAMWLKLAENDGITVGAPEEWQLAEIEDGLPQISPETWGHFVPQWLNLDQLSAVSFKKGCYPGQEVVARMHYLGKPNRRLLAGHINLSSDIEPGTPILLQDGKTEVGEVVRSAPALPERNQRNLLAVVRLGHVNEPMQINGETLYLHRHAFAPSEEAGAH